jgi:hypothetical protein
METSLVLASCGQELSSLGNSEISRDLTNRILQLQMVEDFMTYIGRTAIRPREAVTFVPRGSCTDAPTFLTWLRALAIALQIADPPVVEASQELSILVTSRTPCQFLLACLPVP